jgi:hypothetical protein
MESDRIPKIILSGMPRTVGERGFLGKSGWLE